MKIGNYKCVSGNDNSFYYEKKQRYITIKAKR